MSSLKTWILAPVVAFGLAFAVDMDEANAQFGIYAGRGISISVGGGHYGHRPAYTNSYRARYGHGRINAYRSHRSYGHYDYHPTHVVPHGNHYDVVPGHYDYHHAPRIRHGHYGHH